MWIKFYDNTADTIKLKKVNSLSVQIKDGKFISQKGETFERSYVIVDDTSLDQTLKTQSMLQSLACALTSYKCLDEKKQEYADSIFNLFEVVNEDEEKDTFFQTESYEEACKIMKEFEQTILDGKKVYAIPYVNKLVKDEGYEFVPGYEFINDPLPKKCEE